MDDEALDCNGGLLETTSLVVSASVTSSYFKAQWIRLVMNSLVMGVDFGK